MFKIHVSPKYLITVVSIFLLDIFAVVSMSDYAAFVVMTVTVANNACNETDFEKAISCWENA